MRGDDLAQSYEICKKLNRRHGKSYYYATYLLPKSSRKHIHSIYGFCRYADDIVDSFSPSFSGERQKALSEFSNRFFADLRLGVSDDPVLAAVVNTAKTYEIPTDLFERFLHSMSLDFTQSSYETFDDLCIYMDGSAAVVGEMTLPILQASSEAARIPARNLGIAFQLTNFLRDIGEDLRRGRIYVPSQDIERFSARSAFLNRSVTTEFVALMHFEIERTWAIYKESCQGDVYLPQRSRACVTGARSLYSGILTEIEKLNFDVFARRATVAPWKKFATAVSTIRS